MNSGVQNTKVPQHPALVTSEDDAIREQLAQTLCSQGFRVTALSSFAVSLEWMRQHPLCIAILDFTAPYPTTVLEMLRRFRAHSPHTPIIITSENPTVDSILACYRQGIADYLHLPKELDRLPLAVHNALNGVSYVSPKKPTTTQSTSVSPGLTHVNYDTHCRAMLIGNAPSIATARTLIQEVAPSDMTVLIRGESGTGKDVVARLIHAISPRSQGPFIKVNCPAIPETLFESEFFGYEKGAFTGAMRQKPGRFEMAEKGAIFLDEIGALSLAMQAKLLEVIEHKQFMRVGGDETIHVDTRIITATNAPIEDMIAKGAFRADLFYRLKQFTIPLPPLRERTEDIALLGRHFLHVYGEKYGTNHLTLPADLLERFALYSWPGNVRELEAIIARFALNGDATTLKAVFNPADIPEKKTPAEETLPAEPESLDRLERTAIVEVLQRTRWNRRRAAELLGLSYSALRRRMTKYKLNGPGKKDREK